MMLMNLDVGPRSKANLLILGCGEGKYSVISGHQTRRMGSSWLKDPAS